MNSRDTGNVLRLAQDYFHTVKKTAHPLDAPAPLNDSIKTVGTNLHAFGVPFKVNANDESFIEVQLYLSRDLGRTWSFHARQSTDQQDFPFQANQDGEYWFSLKTLDRDRRLVPEGDPQPELKIIVDTEKPKLDFRIEADAAGRVVCRWTATDNNLLPATLRILYQPIDQAGAAKEWTQVPIKLNGTARVGVYSDQLAWWPETSERKLNVAVEIKDIAGNVAQVDRQVVLPQTGWRHRPQSVAQITDSPREPAGGSWNSRAQSPPESNFQPDSSALQVQTTENINRNPKRDIAQSTSHTAQLVGSEVEYIAPPLPDGYLPDIQPPKLANENRHAVNQNQSGSIDWPSDTEKRTSLNRESVGTTLGSGFRPDPFLAPQPNPQQRLARPVTDVPSNPPTMKRIGDQFVSESSTMGKSTPDGDSQTNQYRGLNSLVGQSLPSPSLLPDFGNQYPDTGQPGFEAIGIKQANLSPGKVRADGIPSGQTSQPNHAGQRAGEWTEPQPDEAQRKQAGFSNAGFANRQSDQSQSVVTTRMPQKPQGPMQIIGSNRFRLDYGIDAIDPSGVARVDLWVTRDGRNWNAWGNDPDNQSPFPVEVEEQGRFGFRIVVHSKDGLTGQGPSTGDEADMWVLIDTQSPLAHITSVPYGRGGEAGRLVINYSVADDQITTRPITLSYSPNADGPWNPIGEGLRNESRFVWKPTSNVPDQIYLRIDALDKAGNVGVHVLSQAIDVSGLVPRGTIRGVSPIPRN